MTCSYAKSKKDSSPSVVNGNTAEDGDNTARRPDPKIVLFIKVCRKLVPTDFARYYMIVLSCQEIV